MNKKKLKNRNLIDSIFILVLIPSIIILGESLGDYFCKTTVIEKEKISYKKLAILFLIVLFFIGFHVFLEDYCYMTNLPKGEYQSSLTSPNNNYVLNAYRYDCGATCAFSIRVEVVDMKTNVKRNIYYQYRNSKAFMKWINDDVVWINGKELNIKNYEICYQCNKGSSNLVDKLIEEEKNKIANK